jgi:predicted MPP superfamily phosphohydrolase
MIDVRDVKSRAKRLSDAAALKRLPPISRPGRGPWVQLIEPFRFEWNRISLPLQGLPAALAGYRILHLSDFHFRLGWSRAYDQLHARIRENPPHLILIGGDYVENKRNYLPGLPLVRRLLDGLTYRDGCFGVLGNHDGRIGPEIDGRNLTLIDRRRVVLDVPGGQLELIGLPRLGKRVKPDQPFIDALPPKTSGVPRLILSHYSDYLRRIPQAAPDIFFAGHTHGGQICLPGRIAIQKHTSLPRRLVSGIHRIGETWFIANRGMGYSSMSLRLFCPSEVIEVELYPDGY